MNSNKFFSAVLVASFALCSATAYAEDAKDGKKPEDFEAKKAARFQKADTNSDGKISKDEFVKARQEKLDEHFKQIDKDSDGFLTKDEFKDWRKHKRAEWKKRFAERMNDEDHDKE